MTSSSHHNGIMSIEKLTGRDNYVTWSFAVKAFLQLEELWDCVVDDSSDTKKDLEAKSILILLVDPMLYVHIRDATTAKEVWDYLSQAFGNSSLTRKVALVKNLIRTTLEGSKNVEDYVNRILTAAHHLRNIHFKVDDEWLGILMLAGLPDIYKPMIMALGSSGLNVNSDLIKTLLLQKMETTDTLSAFYSNGQSKSYQDRNRVFKEINETRTR